MKAGVKGVANIYTSARTSGEEDRLRHANCMEFPWLWQRQYLDASEEAYLLKFVAASPSEQGLSMQSASNLTKIKD